MRELLVRRSVLLVIKGWCYSEFKKGTLRLLLEALYPLADCYLAVIGQG